MPGWENSDRRQRLPPNWESEIVPRIKARDGRRCTYVYANGNRCRRSWDLEVDHIVPNDDHSDDNLHLLCKPHHATKSGKEGAQALAAKKAEIDNRFRRTETHPGLL